MKKLVFLIVLAICLTGCAAKDLSILTKSYVLPTSGQIRDYVAVDAVAPAGLITRTVVIYDDKGKQEYADTESVGGPFNRFMDNGFQGMAIAGGLTGLGATMPGNNYSGGNATASGGSAKATATGGNSLSVSGANAFSSSTSNAFSTSTSSAVSYKPIGCW